MEAKTSAGPAGAHLHGMWAAVAGSWDAYADDVDAPRAAMTNGMLDVAGVGRGDHVLELACGPGGLGLAAAERVGGEGAVVMSDVVAEMTVIAARRARERGLSNVSTREIDLDRIDEPDSTYDVVLCREGLQFALDPAGAVAEIQRVLRPGGRVVIAVWGRRDQNPWLGLVLDAVSAQLGAPIPPPGVPGPFALEDADGLAEILRSADLTDVIVREVPVPMQPGSFEQWWGRIAALTGPLATILASLPDTATEEMVQRARAAVAPYESPTGLSFPGMSLLASARKA